MSWRADFHVTPYKGVSAVNLALLGIVLTVVGLLVLYFRAHARHAPARPILAPPDAFEAELRPGKNRTASEAR